MFSEINPAVKTSTLNTSENSLKCSRSIINLWVTLSSWPGPQNLHRQHFIETSELQSFITFCAFVHSVAYLTVTQSLSRQGDEETYFNTFKFACTMFALVCKCIVLPQETLRSLAKVPSKWLCSLAILPRSFVNSTVSPRNFGLARFLTKLHFFPPPYILNHKTLALPHETLHRLQNFYV